MPATYARIRMPGLGQAHVSDPLVAERHDVFGCGSRSGVVVDPGAGEGFVVFRVTAGDGERERIWQVVDDVRRGRVEFEDDHPVHPSVEGAVDGVAAALGASGDKGDGDVEGVLADDVHDSAEGLPIAGSGDVTGENHQVRGARAGFAIAHVAGDAGDVGGGAGFARGGGGQRTRYRGEGGPAGARDVSQGGWVPGPFVHGSSIAGWPIYTPNQAHFQVFLSRILGNGNACFQGS